MLIFPCLKENFLFLLTGATSMLWATCSSGCKIVEYFGEGTASISCTGKGTITNMGAEIGATTSLFPFDERMAAYLESTGRKEIADLARSNAECLRADDEVAANPADYYDEIIEINLDHWLLENLYCTLYLFNTKCC